MFQEGRMKIKICADGSISMLYTDALPLHEIGMVSVRRASEVEYDPDRKGWTVKFVSGGWLGMGDELAADVAKSAVFRQRGEALAAEVRYLEARL